MNIPVINGNLPSGFCPSSYQEILNGFTAVQSVNIDTSGNRIIVSSTKPTETDVIWLRLDSFGRPLRYYFFSQGAWLSLHPIVPGLTQWWFDDSPNFSTFDGGDANPISDISGPMWQLAKNKDGTTIAAKFPIAAGTLPSTTVLAVGDTGGEESITQTVAQMPSHAHRQNLNNNGELRGNDPGSVVAPNISDVFNQSEIPNDTEVGGGEPMTIMPPWVCGVLLQRSSRLFYAVQ